jgi:hypothetical protein
MPANSRVTNVRSRTYRAVAHIQDHRRRPFVRKHLAHSLGDDFGKAESESTLRSKLVRPVAANPARHRPTEATWRTEAVSSFIFLSHAGIDTDQARQLKRRILDAAKAGGEDVTVWFDKDDLMPASSLSSADSA